MTNNRSLFSNRLRTKLTLAYNFQEANISLPSKDAQGWLEIIF